MKQKPLAILQLLRLPTVFTAMADILLGYLLTHLTLEPESHVALLLICSSCLYLSGMIFNDVCDRKVDAIERPGRPIPSGRVSVRVAIGLGIALVLIGMGCASAVGRQSRTVAAMLIATILGYDLILKRTPLGPVAMGACRFLNVILGASAFERWFQVWARNPQVKVALGLGIYIAGVTWFARQEAKLSHRTQLGAAFGVINLGLGLLVAYVIDSRSQTFLPYVLALLAIIILMINRRLLAAILLPGPREVQSAIRVMLLSIVLLDATLIYNHTNSPAYAIATACLVIPAMVLSRVIPMT